MKLRASLVVAGAAVVLGVASALMLPAMASAHQATQTLKFFAMQAKTFAFTQSAVGIQDTDVNAAGKTVGFDMLHAAITPSGAAAVSITVDTRSGFLYGRFDVTKSGAVTNGRVTGGTGAFAGATGTITVKNISITKRAVTITYST